MPMKVKPPATEPESYPTQDDFKKLFLQITQARAEVVSAHNTLYLRIGNEHEYRSILARYLGARDALDALLQQLIAMQFHRVFEAMGRLEALIKDIKVSTAGRPL